MPRDGRQTRDRILDQAERLILNQGFAATSVEEVIAASSSSKGAFFHHFPSKADLGRALVQRYAEADVDQLHEAMTRAEAVSDDPGVQVVAFVGIFEEMADEFVSEQQQSCLYVSFLYDRQLHGDGTTRVVAEAVIAWREALGRKIAASAELRPLPEGVDPDALADHVFVTFEGAFILARALRDDSHMRTQLGVLRRMLAVALGVS